jgi:hypothetical protein
MSDIISILKDSGDKVLSYATWFWKLVLPDPRTDGITRSQFDKYVRAVRRWRTAWMIVSFLWLLLGYTSAPAGRSVFAYCVFGLVPVAITIVLLKRLPLSTQVSYWRIWLCGTFSIVLPYIFPGILYRYGVSLPSGDPWATPAAALWNGAATMLMVAMNFGAVYLLLRRTRVS